MLTRLFIFAPADDLRSCNEVHRVRKVKSRHIVKPFLKNGAHKRRVSLGLFSSIERDRS